MTSAVVIKSLNLMGRLQSQRGGCIPYSPLWSRVVQTILIELQVQKEVSMVVIMHTSCQDAEE